MVNSTKIKRQMAEVGLTQKALSNETGICQSTLSLKLRNLRPMLLTEAEALSKALKIQSDEFGEYFFATEVA